MTASKTRTRTRSGSPPVDMSPDAAERLAKAQRLDAEHAQQNARSQGADPSRADDDGRGVSGNVVRGKGFVVFPEAAEVAADIIAGDPARFGFLERYRLGFLAHLDKPSGRDCKIIGKAVIVPPMYQALTDGLDALIVVNARWWVIASHVEHQALVTHELLHLAEGVDSEGNLTDSLVGVGHDVEAFRLEVERFGSWRLGIGSLVDAFNVWTKDGGPQALQASRDAGARGGPRRVSEGDQAD